MVAGAGFKPATSPTQTQATRGLLRRPHQLAGLVNETPRAVLSQQYHSQATVEAATMSKLRLDHPCPRLVDVAVFSYNGICCIHPEEQRIKAFREIKRVLRKDAIFIYSTLNKYHPYSFSSFVNTFISYACLGFSTDYKLHLTKSGMMILYENAPEKEISLMQSLGFVLIKRLPSDLKIQTSLLLLV